MSETFEPNETVAVVLGVRELGVGKILERREGIDGITFKVDIDLLARSYPGGSVEVGDCFSTSETRVIPRRRLHKIEGDECFHSLLNEALDARFECKKKEHRLLDKLYEGLSPSTELECDPSPTMIHTD